ncbi:uncharacterized protein C8A04DRAFT_24984 [Dichotomopilus funicola]|uniref:Uncharacterized protein n=1 Tax=Dichotomopilus funicola TaxID=1934379 RepID=A0AAN6ZS78_9PEZI|nr:hypothetical protein C8A04DRAFT_24984 [Dichotomopilus funicola]
MNALWLSRAPADGTATGDKPSADSQKEEPAIVTSENTDNDPAGASASADESTTDAQRDAQDGSLEETREETQGEAQDESGGQGQGQETQESTQHPKRPALQRNRLSVPPPPVPNAPLDSETDTNTNTNTNTGSPPLPDSVLVSSSGPQHPPQGPPPIPPQQPSTQQQQLNTQQPQQQQQQQQDPPPQDSLSLAQLRRIVADIPRAEPIAYDYAYTDTAPTEEEIDEWFMYNFWQWVRLNAANRAFHAAWGRMFPPSSSATANTNGEAEWDGTPDEKDQETIAQKRKDFVTGLLDGVRGSDRIVRAEAVGALVYLVLGRWTETVRAAGVLDAEVLEGRAKTAATGEQLRAMREGVVIVAGCGGLEVVWEVLRGVFELFWGDELPQNVQMVAEELIHLMTIMYMAIQVALDGPEEFADVKQRLLNLKPGLVSFMFHVMMKLRWDENTVLPHTQIFLLFWKSILLVFGGSREIAQVKAATSEQTGCDDKDTITASPLDYHTFRQEITSKYPAYIPPQPLLPLEPDQNTIIPQPNHPPRNSSANGIHAGPTGPGGGASILHQPVHIATPAPSPPPSPAVGGKGGKKQNYQTNQNFPFMYPPLDATSNSAGGKGGAGLQDLLVGRKWEGSDVPASILEAGELFSKRVRMSRATRQLWDEREEFLRFERGYDDDNDDDLIDELDLSELTLEEKEELGLTKGGKSSARSAAASDNHPLPKPPASGKDYGPRDADIDPEVKTRLDAVEAFYQEALPQLQSLVIVLLKQITLMTSNLVSPQTANGPPSARPLGGGPQGQQGQQNQQGQQGLPSNGLNGVPGGKNGGDPNSPLDGDVDELRSREIAAKAVTGTLILLLKWLKLSHVLKFEYVTQLLLDLNYLPMALKIFAMYDVQQVVESRTDRLEHSFFYFCGSRAGAIPPQHAVPNPTATEFEEDVSDDDDDADDALPPPIKRRRSPPSDSLAAAAAALGYPITALPTEPITDFSRRNFFALINYLRIMQKVCKHRAHRNLLMVQYKSSNILRKSLKVPQHQLRLYTLKLFKNQVPYTGRKWRQSNMRVITAVYLHCRPELRDEWLVGAAVEDQVDEALPLEQALRSLTHWFNLRRYPEQMTGGYGGGSGGSAMLMRQAMREEQQDFFVRELEKADWSWLEEGAGGPGGGMNGEEGNNGGGPDSQGMGWDDGSWG